MHIDISYCNACICSLDIDFNNLPSWIYLSVFCTYLSCKKASVCTCYRSILVLLFYNNGWIMSKKQIKLVENFVYLLNVARDERKSMTFLNQGQNKNWGRKKTSERGSLLYCSITEKICKELVYSTSLHVTVPLQSK